MALSIKLQKIRELMYCHDRNKSEFARFDPSKSFLFQEKLSGLDY